MVAESVRQIYPQGGDLAVALTGATHQAGHVPAPGLAMEVATALLCVDASLDEIDNELIHWLRRAYDETPAA